MLSAYTIRDLQMFASLLNLALASSEKEITAVLATIETEISRRLQPAASVKTPPEQVARKSNICPSCGKGGWVPVPNPDGVAVMGCKLCRFSRIEAI